jgi:hypothetical protein
MRLKYIEFDFENCDSIRIDGKYVGNFLVEDIRTVIRRTACNSVDRMDVAHTFAIEIHKDANVERYAFGQDGNEDFKEMTFDRFDEYGDITSVHFVLEEKVSSKDGVTLTEDSYDYYVDWTGECDYINDSQKNYISSLGHLYIVINDNKTIDDYFDMDMVESESDMEHHFKLLEIGNKYHEIKKQKDGE